MADWGTRVGILICLSLIMAACGRDRTYEGRGRVAGFGDDGRTIIVEHEEIEGLMPAMTMSFTAADSSNLSGLRQGDAISFRLSVSSEHSRISEILRLPDDALPEHPASTLDAGSAPHDAPLDSGDPVPPVVLTTHADSTLSFTELQGKSVVLTFIYTRCPLPEFCPLMSKQMADVQRLIGDLKVEDVHLLSISFDPEYDTPDVLRAYAARYTSDLSNWTFATGESDAIRDLATRFGVYYQSGGEEFTHNLTTALIGPDGRVVRMWRGNDWKPDEVIESIRRIAPPGSNKSGSSPPSSNK